MLAHVEAIALAAEQILRRHDEILDLDLRMAAAEGFGQRAVHCHGLDIADDLIAGVGQFDDEGRIALMARRVGIGHRHDERDVGDAGGGGEPLLAVQHVILVAVLHRAGLHAGGVGARRFLGHRIADALLAVEQRLEILLLLMLGAVRQQRHHRRVIGALRVHRQRAEMAFAKLHLDESVGERPKPHAAIFLGDERTPQALRTRLGAQFIEDRLVILARDQPLFSGLAFVMHPLAHPLADRLGLGRDFEIDRHVITLLMRCPGLSPVLIPSSPQRPC